MGIICHLYNLGYVDMLIRSNDPAKQSKLKRTYKNKNWRVLLPLDPTTIDSVIVASRITVKCPDNASEKQESPDFLAENTLPN